jgi:hypothetical protein
MSQLSKQALKVGNQTSFPNNNTNYITPAILRDFNIDMIDSMVDEIPYGQYTQSVDTSIDALNAFTASASGLTTGSLLITASAAGNVITFTKGNGTTFGVTVATGSIPDISNLNQATASLQAYTASANVKFSNLESTTASLNTSVSNINTFTASAAVSITNLNASSASQQTSINNLNGATGSYATTGSNTFTGANTFTSISASSFVSASQFVGDGSKLTGLTSSISMPILDEGIPQGNAVSLNFTGSAIGATVVGGVAIISVSGLDTGSYNQLTASFNSYTASTNADLAAIHQATASLQSNSASVNISITNVNSATASLFTSVNNINSTTASLNTSASLALVTASFDNGTRNLTFTKGDTTTFAVNIPDVSGSNGNFVTTSSFNAYTQSNDQRVSSLEIATSSLYTSASLSLTTASISGQLLSFTKGNNSQFTLLIPTGSGTYVTGSYGAFHDQTTQSGSANTPHLVKFSNTDISDGVILSGSTGLKVGAYGVYNLQFSLQAKRISGTGTDTLDVWFRKNGIDIPWSNTSIGLDGGVEATRVVPAWNYMDTLNINDVLEIAWQATDTNVQLIAEPASGSLPAIPSAIATLNRVDVGGGSNSVSTSSFNAYTASTNSSITQLNASSASQQVSIDNLNQKTGSFATTGSNQFNGNQTVNGFVSASNGFYSGDNTTALNIGDGSNIRFWSGSTGGTEYFNIQLVPSVGDVAFSRSGAGNVKVMTLAGVAGNNTTFQNNPVVFNGSVSSLTVNAQSTAISGSGSYTLSAASITEAAVTATTTATASVIGTFSVTGQTGGDGKVISLGHSGSLVLTNSSVTPTYSSLTHISSSAANANTNFIFKSNTNTGDTIVSSSANIFTNPAAPTAGFKRYITGGNIAIGGAGAAVPQISASMAWSPVIANNVFANSATPLTYRGPVSASQTLLNNNVFAGGALNLGSAGATPYTAQQNGTTATGNIIGGTIAATAYKTPLSSSTTINQNVVVGSITANMDSSSVSVNGNNVNGGLTINNSYLPSTINSTTDVVVFGTNIVGGTLTAYYSGSNTTTTGAQRNISNGLSVGLSNVISASFNGDNSSLNSFGLIGQSLLVYANNSRATAATATDYGSIFVGRWNDITGVRAYTAETVFAVGTGTAEASRKTGFLIDSGSNVFVEGSLNVSGSTYMTGSLILSSSNAIELQVIGNAEFTGSVAGNVVSASITSNTASIDFNLGNYFEVTSSVTPLHLNVTNIKPGTTSTLIVSASASSSILFSPNVAQPSGSAYSGSAGSIDILSLVAFNTSKVNLVSTKALI